MADRHRSEAANLALFDLSKEACLARKYEAVAERGFFRALKELRRLRAPEGPSPAVEEAARTRASLARLGSILPEQSPSRPEARKPAPTPPMAPRRPVKKQPPIAWDPAPVHSTEFDLPFSIGLSR